MLEIMLVFKDDQKLVVTHVSMYVSMHGIACMFVHFLACRHVHTLHTVFVCLYVTALLLWI